MFLSIIIPVYNKSEYLEMCFRSIKKIQLNEEELEIIFVNDGSTDKSGELVEQFAELDERVRVIHQINSGLSAARNRGMEEAVGEYIFFWDADDWVDDNYFECCVDYLRKTNSDIMVTSYIKEYSKVKVTIDLLHYSSSNEISNNIKEYGLRWLLGDKLDDSTTPLNLNQFNTAWGKFYKRSLIVKLQFTDVSKIGNAEDLLFNVEAFCIAKDVHHLSAVYYHYNKNDSSSMISVYDPRCIEKNEALFSLIDKLICAYGLGDEYKNSFIQRKALTVFCLLIRLGFSDMAFYELVESCKKINEITTYKQALLELSTKKLPIYWKLLLFLLKKDMYLLVMLIVVIMVKVKRSL